MNHELIKDDLSLGVYISYGLSSSVLRPSVLPRCGGQPTFMHGEGGTHDDRYLHPIVGENIPDIDLPRDFLKNAAATRAFPTFDRDLANRQQLEHLMAMVTPIRWLLLLLSMMLAPQVLADELGCTVSHLDYVQSSETYDEFQLTLLAQTSEMNIRLNKLQGRIKRHAHPQSNHFLYLIKGQFELTVGDETKVVGAGDFVTIPQGIPHAMKRIGDSEALFLDVASPPDVGDVVWYE